MRLWLLTVALAGIVACDEAPARKLPVPEFSPLADAPPPPPPPPPPEPGAAEPPAALLAYVDARAHRPEPWQVTLVDLATNRRANLSPAAAAELITRLSSYVAWTNGQYGCVSTGMDLRLSRGSGPPLVLWTSCGNVKLDHTLAAFSKPTVTWLRDQARALDLTPP